MGQDVAGFQQTIAIDIIRVFVKNQPHPAPLVPPLFQIEKCESDRDQLTLYLATEDSGE
jgi:hypothetical protein